MGADISLGPGEQCGCRDVPGCRLRLCPHCAVPCRAGAVRCCRHAAVHCSPSLGAAFPWVKKAGSLIEGKRWSFFHGPDLDPLTGTVLLSHPGPVQMCCLHLCSAHFPLTGADIHGIFSLCLSLSPFASRLLCSDKVHCALPVRAQKKTSSLQCPDRSPTALGAGEHQVLSLGEGSSVPSTFSPAPRVLWSPWKGSSGCLGPSSDLTPFLHSISVSAAVRWNTSEHSAAVLVYLTTTNVVLPACCSSCPTAPDSCECARSTTHGPNLPGLPWLSCRGLLDQLPAPSRRGKAFGGHL